MHVLLSIKPIYVNEILAGKKIFEFRKSIFKKKDISKVFIYSSSPVKKIVASFEIAKIIADSPQKLWDKCQKYGGISENDFFDYFKNSDIGYAIEITNLKELSEPINPYKLKKNFRPPQSYCYIPLDYFENRSINSTPRVKNQDLVLLESDYEYLTNLDDNNNNSKTQKQTKLFNGNEFQKMTELSEELLKNSIIKEEKVGWVETELLSISSKITDGSHNPPSKSKFGEPMLSAQNIYNDGILFEEYRLIRSEEFEEEYKRANVESGDVLLTIVGTIGRSTVVPEKIKRFTLQRSVALIKPIMVNPHYLSFYLRSPEIQLFFQQNSKGTAQKGIYLNSLKNLPVYLAPFPEQRAIVSKIEQLFSELDNGIANLKLAQEQLKVYRQAVLKKAFEGELTRKWREQQTDLPDKGELLEQIRKEREEAVNVSSKKTKLKRDEITDSPIIYDSDNLPNSWCWVKVDSILFNSKKGMTTGPFGTALKKHEHQKNGIPVYGIENIGEGVFRMPNKIFITEEKAKELQAFEVKPYDIIISRSGTVGEICSIPEKIINGIISTNLIRVRLNLDIISTKYFVYLFQGGNVREQVKELCKGSTRAFLNQTILSSINFPLCSLPEQQAIVQEIETRLSVCDKIEQDIETNLEKAEALRQSILKKAFKGKLLNERELAEVRGAEDWEPAEVLLERIKKERAGNGKK